MSKFVNKIILFASTIIFEIKPLIIVKNVWKIVKFVQMLINVTYVNKSKLKIFY